MKAVAYQQAGGAFADVELPEPAVGEYDLLVAVKAVSVNPVDVTVQRSTSAAEHGWKILGWDAAGVVTAVGSRVTQFAVGDEVWYAGDLTRPGSNAERQAVDSRLVARKPKSLDFAAAAAMPLTSLTAWEMLFDRFQAAAHDTAGLLVIGGAGGVGSMTVQLAKALTQLHVTATASRPQSAQWVKDLGADAVIDHTQPLPPQLHTPPQWVFSTTHTADYVPQIAQLIQPQGKFGLIDDDAIDIRPLKSKSVSIHWEFMYTRSMFHTPDMARQGEILQQVADLVDAGKIRSTLNTALGHINAATLTRAHELVASGRAVGKVVLSGF